MTESTDTPILTLENVKKHFNAGSTGVLDRLLDRGSDTPVRAINDVSIAIERGEIIGIVGESGCGKSTTAKVISGLLTPTEGEVKYRGQNVSELPDEQFNRACQMIFQDPYESLNPSFSVYRYLAEPLRAHGYSGEEIEEKINDILELIGLDPDEYADKYPHELSGGEKQRVHIASALVLDPEVLICDEPTSMLDVSIRSQILEFIRDINRELDMTIIYISHDIATTRYLCDRLLVMYLGEIVEAGPIDEVVTRPKHPYTQMLISAIPTPDPDTNRDRVTINEGNSIDEMNEIEAQKQCKFASRCSEAMDICEAERPSLVERDGIDWLAACHLYEPVEVVESNDPSK